MKSLLSNIFSSGLKSSSAGDGSVASGFSEETDELDDDTSTDGGTDRGENELEGVSNESLLAGEKGLSTEYSSHIVKAEFDLSVDADEKDTYKLMYKSEKDSKHNVEESKNYLDQLIADRAESKDYSNEDIEHSQLYGDPVNVSSVDEDAIVAGKYDSVTVDASNESDRYVIGEISESIKEEKVKKKKKEKNDWNYTTKTKKSSAIIPFLVLVCVPNFLQHSLVSFKNFL